MLIGTYTGATSYEGIRTSKSFATLLIEANLASGADSLAAYKLSAYINKKVGGNVVLFNKIQLIDLFLMSGLDNFNSYKNASKLYSIVVDLSKFGNLSIEQGDEITFAIEGTTATHSLKLYGFEEPASSNTFNYFEQKTLLSEYTNTKLDNLQDYDILSLDNLSYVVDATLTFDNGTQIKYLPDELKYISRNLDFFGLVRTETIATTPPVTSTTIDPEFSNRLILPIVGVTAIEINKTANVLNVTLMQQKSL